MKLIKAVRFCFAFVLLLQLVESGVIVRFDRAPLPRSRFSFASFRYSVLNPDGSNACGKHHNCSIHCEIDAQTVPSCSSGSATLENLTANQNHRFLVNVTTLDGDTNSSSYNWFIDSIPPTASITTERSYTNTKTAAISITFSELCTVEGGFKCTNTSACGVLINGPAEVVTSTFQMLKPDIKYNVMVSFSSKLAYGRVVIRMVDNFCTDEAGNKLARTNGSAIVVHFDRRPVQVDLWTSVSSYELKIDRVPRTVLATNKNEELEIFLDFSDPVVNSTMEIMSALNTNAGDFVPIHGKTHDNRRFAFELRNVVGIKIVTIKFQSALIIGRTGTAVSSVTPISFMYDSTKPSVRLTTISPPVTKESDIDVVVEFTKPVFGFQTSGVKVGGGRVTRFKELSKSFYSLRVTGMPRGVISVVVPEGNVNDIEGNPNLTSNKVEVRQYSPPAISAALHSFVTAGLLVTSLASVVLSLSSANLGAIGLLTSGTTDLAFSDPSRNLLGMIGHLQVFVFSDWILENRPLDYSETTKGLRWLIPREKLPWEKEKMASYETPGRHNNHSLESTVGVYYRNPANNNTALDSNRSPYLQQKIPSQDELQQNKSIKLTTYGQPLEPDEYSIYFLREEPPVALLKTTETYTGWKDLEMNLFWLGMGGGSLLAIHLLTLLFLRWRTGLSVQGTLTVPRFELFILISMLPCISQSSAFVIRGGTTKGIIAGTLLLAIPGVFILSVSILLVMAIFVSDLVQYKQMKHTGVHHPWYAKLLAFFLGEPTQGKWFYREVSPSTFLVRLGFLFEDRKGPPVFVLVDQNEPHRQPKWIDSGQSIGRMREVHFDNGNEEHRASMSMKLVGYARSTYLLLDLLRRAAFGILAGAYSSPRPSQSITALTLTLAQLLYLFILKPYIRRGVHVAESVSLLSEATMFGLSLSIAHKNYFEEKTMGFIMLSLLFISFLSQLVNEWYALVRWLLRLPQTSSFSFKLGVKLVAKGFILPFLSRKYWLKIVPESSQTSTGVAPVLPQSRETESARKNEALQHVDSSGSMAAKIVPVFSPESECSKESRQTSGVKRASEVNGQTGFGLESKNEIRKLREMAKASFVGNSKAGGSYAPKDQNGSNESLCSNNSQTSSPMKRH